MLDFLSAIQYHCPDLAKPLPFITEAGRLETTFPRISDSKQDYRFKLQQVQEIFTTHLNVGRKADRTVGFGRPLI